MESLRKRGKEKLRFRRISHRVSSRDFKYFKRLFLDCLRENEAIVNSLIKFYRRIQIFFFYNRKESGIGESVRDFLGLSIIPNYEGTQPATTTSKNGLGCILFFIQHMKEYTEKRDDIEDIKDYHKNGVFEELCHLVEQKGDSSIVPDSADKIFQLYYKSLGRRKIDVGFEIISSLDSNRNHYEVYLMMMKAYPKSWFYRFSRFYEGESDPIAYKEKYERWKVALPKEVSLGRLFSDYLKNLSFMFVIKEFPRDLLSTEEEKKLDKAISLGDMNLKSKKELLLSDLPEAESSINTIGGYIFEAPEIFFNFILDFLKTHNVFR